MSISTTKLATTALLAISISGTAFAGKLDEVQKRGALKCGVSTGVVGFSAPDAKGVWQGFDVGMCRAVAAAVLGDPKAVEFVPQTSKTRFSALASGEIDMLSRTTTWTFSRDVDLKVEFAGVNFYDGQGFLVSKKLGVNSALEMDGATICVKTGTTSELNLADYFRTNGMKFDPVPVEVDAEAVQQLVAGSCDAFSTDSSKLNAHRASMAKPDNYKVLPEIISKEPLGPAVLHGDQQWGDIVRWTLNALMTAEELGVTSNNVDDMAANSKNPEVRRLLGVEGNLGAMAGLKADWAQHAIKSVGNYGELFDNTIGANSPIGIKRGLNALWTKGGLQYSPPFR
jgi:general L-amino acid transport system substrate-binding protein